MMNPESSFDRNIIDNIIEVADQAYQCLLNGELDRAVILYEQAIASEPEVLAHYAYLGLVLLLQGNESDAQLLWMSAVDDLDCWDSWINELVQILNREAVRYISQSNLEAAWLIRKHIQEITALSFDNIAELVKLSIIQPELDPEEESLSHLIELLKDDDFEISEDDRSVLHGLIEYLIDNSANRKIDPSIFKALESLDPIQKNRQIISFASDQLQKQLALVEIYLLKFRNENKDFIVNVIYPKVRQLPPQIKKIYAQIFLKFDPNSPYLLKTIIGALQTLHLNISSLEFAYQLTGSSYKTTDQITGYYCVVKGLLNAGIQWQESCNAYQEMFLCIQTLIQQNQTLNFEDTRFIISCSLWSYHLRDIPSENHKFIGDLGYYYQSKITDILGKLPPPINQLNRLKQLNQLQEKQSNPVRELKIGYIARCFYRHSVGWISRWLLTNHNPERFEVFVYSFTQTNDNVQSDIRSKVSTFRDLQIRSSSQSIDIKAIAQQIQDDEIDILVDLDSLTSADTCAIVALKPAPIQVTWLGSDASGVPAIDYYIADRYVLPEDAQSYYRANIWRLPTTYLAVNGFEVGTPNLKRQDLDIPTDAIVYMSVQSPHKRSPEFLRCQMQVLAQVPNSYFLLKSFWMTSDCEDFILEIAMQAGISKDRIKFLPTTPTEEVHRANLAIADVILDTYPYTGATTTLEALWMELPIVTRVGESFVSRNSYTMMLNAGISEGIAWSDQEYIDWGVRLGKDADLRQQIVWKLKKSKQTAPLWNIQQFVQDMELAYQQMWTEYSALDTYSASRSNYSKERGR